MNNFIGSKCIVCNKLFEKDDDIVVCPECGTPYHRECYNIEGECVNTDLHITKTNWQPDKFANVQDGEVICKSCGTHNDVLSMFCKKCGSPLITVDEDKVKKGEDELKNIEPQAIAFNSASVMANFNSPTCGFNPEETFDDGQVKLSELASAVGSNTHYFLPAFKRFKDKNAKIFPNFISFLAPEIYCAYRKMYIPLAINLVLIIINTIANFLLVLISQDAASMPVHEQMLAMFGPYEQLLADIGMITYLIQFAIRILMGMFLNFYYYKLTLKRIKNTKANMFGKSEEEINEVIRKKGGVSNPLMVGVIVAEMLFSFAFIMWMLA